MSISAPTCLQIANRQYNMSWDDIGFLSHADSSGMRSGDVSIIPSASGNGDSVASAA